MPVYVFQCPVCDSTKEVLQSYQDEAPDCTECAHEGTQSYWVKMVRVPASSNFVVHGFKASNGYSGSHE